MNTLWPIFEQPISAQAIGLTTIHLYRKCAVGLNDIHEAHPSRQVLLPRANQKHGIRRFKWWHTIWLSAGRLIAPRKRCPSSTKLKSSLPLLWLGPVFTMTLLTVMISPRMIANLRRLRLWNVPQFFSTFDFFSFLSFFPCHPLSPPLFCCWFFLRVLWISNFGLLLSATTSVPVREGNAIPH